MNDDEIINLFLKRDENGIIELSTKYHPYCYKIAWNLLANREDAEECLNDTWFSVWSQIPPTHPPVLAHFCGRITRNLSIDRLRKKFAAKCNLYSGRTAGRKRTDGNHKSFFGRDVSKGQIYFCTKILVFGSCFCNLQKASYVSGKRENEFIQKPEKAVETVGKRRRTHMKKFDFSKEFGNIDPKYIEEAEREWSDKKENWRPKWWSKAAAACVIVTLGSVIFSNPHIQASIKNITLSIGETLGFPKSIESYTEVLNTSKEDKGITVTLKEVVLDNGVLLTKVHAEKTSSGQKDTDDVQDDWTFANTQLDIDYQKTTINGQKIEEYESGHLLPYSDEDLLNTGLDENVYDAVLESRFSLDGDLGENPEVHLVLGAYQNENLGEDYFAEFEFDFSIPHEELMKQTVHKKLEDVSVKTEEGTVKLTDFSMNKLQSIIKAEIPEELEEKLYNGNEMMLMGTDSKGNQVQYELRSNSADGKSQWSFKTSFWGMYQLDSDGPVLLLPDIDSDYLELQLYTREPYMAAADTIWVDDDFVEIGETTEEVEEVPEDTLEGENPSDAEEQVETQIIGGAVAPTEVRLQDDTDQKENTDAANKTDEDYGTEESAYDGTTGEITAESDWTPVGEKIRIQIK